MELTVQDIKDFLRKQKICSSFDGKILEKKSMKFKDGEFFDFGRGKFCLVNLKEKYPSEMHVNRIEFKVLHNNGKLQDLSVEWIEFLLKRYKQEYVEYLCRKLKREKQVNTFFETCEAKKVEISKTSEQEIIKFIENTKAKEKDHKQSIDKLQDLVKKQLEEEKTF